MPAGAFRVEPPANARFSPAPAELPPAPHGAELPQSPSRLIRISDPGTTTSIMAAVERAETVPVVLPNTDENNCGIVCTARTVTQYTIDFLSIPDTVGGRTVES